MKELRVLLFIFAIIYIASIALGWYFVGESPIEWSSFSKLLHFVISVVVTILCFILYMEYKTHNEDIEGF